MPNLSSKISVFTNSQVSEILKKAKRVLKHPGLDILCHPSPISLDKGRILVITSAKVGNSVQRNLIRRRIKAIFYEEKLYENKCDYICIIKRPGINLTFEQLKEILLGILEHRRAKNSPNFY